MPTSRLDALKQQIEAAFADAIKPEDDRIGYDPHDGESQELAYAFKGKHWKDIPREDLQYNSSTFLSPEGFRYYLPAYLLAALDDHGDLLPRSVYGLMPDPPDRPSTDGLSEWQRTRFEPLSPLQKHAVRAFLEYVRDKFSQNFPESHAPGAALERYWGRQ